MLTVAYYVGPQSAAEKEYREWAFGLWFSLVQHAPQAAKSSPGIAKERLMS